MLAIIPARGGSKGIPRKNLMPLCGKPLIQYTVEAAMQSRSITHVVLSTDDEEIAQACAYMGLNTAYRRPPELAQDDTPMAATLVHCLQWARGEYGVMDSFMMLQPTSPLRQASDIDAAVDKYRAEQALSLISVNRMTEHPYECVEWSGGQNWSYVAKNHGGASRRQDYESAYYYINGAIYIANAARFSATGRLIDESSLCFYEMPRARSVDIDERIDLLLAEALLSQPNS